VRILGRPTLLVEHPSTTAHGQPPSADADVRVVGVDSPGAVEVTASLSARMQDLLVYLAVHPDGVRRDSVVAELWPDTDRRRPGNNLSSLISRLRAAVRAALDRATLDGAADAASTAEPDARVIDRVGPIVLVEGDRYRLDHGRIAVDYWTFLADAAAATTTAPYPSTAAGRMAPVAGGADAGRGTELDESVLQRLQRAHGLYRGVLAEGIDHAWILSVREATRRTFLALTARLVRHHVATDPAAAFTVLETVRNLEPTNQSIYRDIMALQLRLGDNDAAAATLRLLENQLADVEEALDDATRSLARTIGD
jgi:DNA-binding SARP family transcriptional activator